MKRPKIKKVLLILFAIVLLLEIAFWVLLRNSFVGYGIFYFFYKTQESRQIKEHEDRKKNPPSASELEVMVQDETYCFHNADCRRYPTQISDCNDRPANKYYCEAKGCLSALMGCPPEGYFVCEDNKCVEKYLPSIKSLVSP